MNRTNRILAVVLALQILVAAVILWPRSTTAGAGGEPLFANLEADQIVQLTITDGTGTDGTGTDGTGTDGTGRQIQLAKGPEGWGLPEADDFPTTENSVPDLLAKIVALKASPLVTQTPASHERLRVAASAFERRITFELADGTAHTLYVGTSPSFGASHVRADGQDEVYLTSDLSASDAATQPSAWIDTAYLTVPREQIVSLTLENANGTFRFEKVDDGAWTMIGLAADETLKESAVTSLLSRVSSVRMTRPLGKTEQPDYGLQTPSAVVAVEAQDPEGTSHTYTLRVGAQSEEDQSYVIGASESPYYVRVSSYTADDLVQKTREDFLELPPTPTPEPTAESPSGG
jgi:hypothetical protein